MNVTNTKPATGSRLWRPYVISRKGVPYLWRVNLARSRSQFRGWSVKLHRFLDSDRDECLHDHPWSFASLILWGGYFEMTKTGTVWRRPLSFSRRPADWAHRVILAVRPCLRCDWCRCHKTPGSERPLQWGTSVLWMQTICGCENPSIVHPLTLFFTGPRVRLWGFLTRRGWTPWRDFEEC